MSLPPAVGESRDASLGPETGGGGGTVRLTARPNRELVCRQRLPQNFASGRRPSGIGSPHHAQVSGGGEGERAGWAFSLARDAACRQGLAAELRLWAQAVRHRSRAPRAPARSGRVQATCRGSRRRWGERVAAGQQLVCDLERGTRSPLHGVDVNAGARGVGEHLADRGLAPLGGRVRPRPLRVGWPAARWPVGEPVAQLLGSAVQVVSRARRHADASPGPAGGRARRVARGLGGAGLLGGFLAYPLARTLRWSERGVGGEAAINCSLSRFAPPNPPC